MSPPSRSARLSSPIAVAVGPPRPYLSDLVVSPRHRRKGVGTALIRACEEACTSWGYDRMYLKVAEGNVAAQRLYENLGYQVYLPKNDKDEVTLCGVLDVVTGRDEGSNAQR